MLDIKKVYIRQSAPIALKHPETGEDLGCSIWLSGKHSDVFAAPAKIYTEEFERISAEFPPVEGESESDKNERTAKMLTEIYKKLPAFMAALTTGWDGLQANGEDIPFSTEKALELYTAPETKWILNQVHHAHNARVYPTDFFSGKPPFVTPAHSATTPAPNSDSTPSEKTGEATT